MVNNKVFRILEEYLAQLKGAKYKSGSLSKQSIIYKPFFSSLQVKEESSLRLEILDGGTVLKENDPDPSYLGRVEIRAGGYKKGGFDYGVFLLPMELDRQASLLEIWRTANMSFWDCMDDYLERYHSAVGIEDKSEIREKYAYFSKEDPVRFTEKEKKISLDFGGLEEMLKDVSRKLSADPQIYSSEIGFDVASEGRYFISSEGSRIFTSDMRYSMSIILKAVDSKNLVIPHREVFRGMDLSGIPSYDELMAAGERCKKELIDIIRAPMEKNGVYPAILDSENHGVLWHEVIGHALEAHRLQEDEFGDMTSIFKGRVGDRIAPQFLSVSDDPTIKHLDGHYLYDEEGVKARRVDLIVDGTLKDYLHSRQSAGYFNTKSNGHARAEGVEDPCPRMSNIIVKSSNDVPFEELKENLIRQCIEQNKEYGLLFEECNGGLTLHEESFFNTFPANVSRVYRNGKTERVRGVYIVGTPEETLRNIIQTSDEYDVFNGYCGAESGQIPSTQTAPHALVRSVEVNRIPKSAYALIKKQVLKKPE